MFQEVFENGRNFGISGALCGEAIKPFNLGGKSYNHFQGHKSTVPFQFPIITGSVFTDFSLFNGWEAVCAIVRRSLRRTIGCNVS